MAEQILYRNQYTDNNLTGLKTRHKQANMDCKDPPKSNNGKKKISYSHLYW
jgi:hypothetical protein